MLKQALMLLALGISTTPLWAKDAAKGSTEAKGELTEKDLREAADFTLPGSDGKSYNLYSLLAETPVVLEWWNPDCPYVKRHYESKNMQNLQTSLKGDAKWFRVLSSAKGEQGYYEKDKIQEITKGSGSADVVVLMDADGKVGKLYGATNTPHMYVIGKGKKVYYEGAIDDNPRGDKKAPVDFVTPAVARAKTGKPAQPIKTKAYGCGVKYAS